MTSCRYPNRNYKIIRCLSLHQFTNVLLCLQLCQKIPRLSFHIRRLRQFGAKPTVIITLDHHSISLFLLYYCPVISPGLVEKSFAFFRVFCLSFALFLIVLLIRLLVEYVICASRPVKNFPRTVLQILPIFYITICLPAIHNHSLIQSIN